MVLSMDRWVGKVAVVTGASSGIGAAIVEQLVKNGLIVAGVARRADLVEENAKKLSKEKGKLHGVQADFSKETEITKAFKWITENLGPVHILINNAGYGGGTANLTGDCDPEIWRKTFDLNVLGLSIATKEAVNIMTKNKINGHVIHISSVLGHRVVNIPGLNVYPASKFAVTALTETLRQELNRLGSKIKITSVSPGFVATERTTLNKNLSPEKKAIMGKRAILEAEDIADGVVYVLSTPEHVQVHELTIQPVGEL